MTQISPNSKSPKSGNASNGKAAGKGREAGTSKQGNGKPAASTSKSAPRSSAAPKASLVKSPVPLPTASSLESAASKAKAFGFLTDIQRLWGRQSLRRKATMLGFALGVVPVFVVGAIGYQVISRSVRNQIVTAQESRSVDLSNQMARFTQDRVADAEAIALVLGNAKLANGDKVRWLNNFLAVQGLYDSIVFFNPDGNLILQSNSNRPFPADSNYSDREYFQRAIATDAPAVNDPSVSKSSGRVSFEVAAPVRSATSGELLGVVRTRLPAVELDSIFTHLAAEGFEYKLVNSSGTIFGAEEEGFVGASLGDTFSRLPEIREDLMA
ncbi:MAG: cache domain-containing protein, partial [Cyanobacteria bacterium J06648_11]